MQIFDNNVWGFYGKLEDVRKFFKKTPTAGSALVIHNDIKMRVTPRDLKGRILTSIELPDPPREHILAISYRTGNDGDGDIIYVEANEDTVITRVYTDDGYRIMVVGKRDVETFIVHDDLVVFSKRTMPIVNLVS